MKVLDSYDIQLDVTQSDKTKKNIADLKSNFADTHKSLEAINAEFLESIKGQQDVSKEAKVYNSLISKRIGELEKEADLITYTSTTEGKRDRERLRALKAEGQARNLTRDELKEIERLEKSVLDLDDSQLETMLKVNQAQRIQLKQSQAEMKQRVAAVKAQKTLKELVKEDLKGISERIKKQREFIKSLKTTEGRYLAIKKAAGLAGKGAKVAAKFGAGAMGVAAGLVGGSVGSAEGIAQQEAESKRMRAELTPDEKMALIDAIYIKTGADSASIVNAVNRVYTQLKTDDPDRLLRAAIQEVKFPGSSMLLQSQTGVSTDKDFEVLGSRMRAMQSVTGATSEGMQNAANVVSNMRGSAFKKGIAQTDLLALYSALQGTGAYDNEEDLMRAMRSFLRQSDLTRENFYDKMQIFDWSKTVMGAQNKNQAKKGMQSIDFTALREASLTTDTSQKQTAAESAAETARRVAKMKDELMVEVLKIIEPMLKDGTLKSLIQSAFDLIKGILPVMKPLLEAMKTVFEEVAPIISEIVKKLTEDSTDPKEGDNIVVRLGKGIGRGAKGLFNLATTGSLTQKAQGGIALSPTIVGERGAEAVIPLDYSRRGRATSIMQNISQTFNMNGNQTTGLSLGQAVKQRSFTDNLISSRLYGG